MYSSARQKSQLVVGSLERTTSSFSTRGLGWSLSIFHHNPLPPPHNHHHPLPHATPSPHKASCSAPRYSTTTFMIKQGTLRLWISFHKHHSFCLINWHFMSGFESSSSFGECSFVGHTATLNPLHESTSPWWRAEYPSEEIKDSKFVVETVDTCR